MYAYTREIGRGFFEGVCVPSKATAHYHDPPHHRMHALAEFIADSSL
jgi:hypothetical protein